MGEIEVKSPRVLSDLTENTDTSDNDILIVGNNGGNIVHRITFGNIVNALKNKFLNWVFDDLSTTSKTVVGAINELDSDVSELNSNISDINSNITELTNAKINMVYSTSWVTTHSVTINDTSSSSRTWCLVFLSYNGKVCVAVYAKYSSSAYTSSLISTNSEVTLTSNNPTAIYSLPNTGLIYVLTNGDITVE